MAPLGQPVGRRIKGADFAGYIVGYEHLKKLYFVRYEDQDYNSFPAREFDVYRNNCDFM
jgi:hypothetical protein